MNARFKSLFSKNYRTRKMQINVLLMMLVKGLSIALTFVMLPMTVGYVSSSVYGIWLTLSSIVAWISFFDIGINNGLRNRLTEAIASGDSVKSKKLVSTTYAILVCIFIPLAILLLLINCSLNWGTILNIKNDTSLNMAVAVIIIYFSLNFIFSTINVIMTSYQKPAYASILNFLQQLFTLLIIVVLVHTTHGSLLLLCLALCLSPLIVLLAYNFILFYGKYNTISPSVKYIDFSLAKDLFGLGIKFFLIQIAVIILFQSSNFIMIRYYGPESVTQYNVAYKYFFALNMVWTIWVSPLWTSTTDALAKNDMKWVKNIMKKYIRMLFVFILCLLVMLLISNKVYYIWMGRSISSIPFSLSLSTALFVLASLTGQLFSAFLNGAGILKMQLFFSCFGCVIFLCCCLVFIKILRMGVYCIPLAIFLSSFYSYLISPVQCYLYFFKKKRNSFWVN